MRVYLCLWCGKVVVNGPLVVCAACRAEYDRAAATMPRFEGDDGTGPYHPREQEIFRTARGRPDSRRYGGAGHGG